MTTILINGIGTVLGARVAQLLSRHDDHKLIGLDTIMPVAPVGRAEVLTAGLDGHQMVELLRREAVETVIHVGFAGEEQATMNREAAVRQNVLGSMELLGACAASGVRRVVVRSSSLVYGASPTIPAFINEQYALSETSHSDIIRDYGEIDSFAREFAERQPRLAVVLLRCAGLVGGGVWSPLARYLTQPAPPTNFGFNPRIQVLHPDDAAAGFALAALTTVCGVFNLAAREPIKLEHAIRLAGQQPLALSGPLLRLRELAGRAPGAPEGWPFDRSFLRYSCVVDTSRAQAELGWQPEYPAGDALRELSEDRKTYNERAQAEAALHAFLARETGQE